MAYQKKGISQIALMYDNDMTKVKCEKLVARQNFEGYNYSLMHYNAIEKFLA